MQTTHDRPPPPDSQYPPEGDDPWPVDITGHDNPPCDCPPPPKSEPKPPCTRSKPPRDVCCEMLLAMLDPKSKQRRGAKIHKPKTPSKVKLANLCCDWPVKDAIAPLMVLLFERATAGLTPRSAFEAEMYGFINDKMSPKHKAAFQIGVDAYRKIPDGRRCAFETRFDEWPRDRPIGGDFVAKVVAQEILALGRYGVFNKSDGQASIGEQRLWDLTFPAPPDSTGGPKTLTGPWPWICAVNPGADNQLWYRNHDLVVPDNSDYGSVKFDAHEYNITCAASADPSNPTNLIVDCKDNVIGPPPGSMGFADCDGGFNYHANGPGLRCLAIPRCVAGQGVALRGFNFLSLQSTVLVKKVGGGFPDMILPCDVMGDDDPPTTGASCSVRDIATITLPKSVRDGLNDLPVPLGRYSVELHVPNESHYAPEPGPAPAEFVSNTALIDIIPPLDIDYQFWFERGDCFEETSGPGDDEPWFRSYTATYKAVGKQVIQFASADIFRQEDIESGDWIGFNPVTPFAGKLERDGCVAIAVTGLEVDSDDAAEEQVTDFGDAYILYFKQLLVGAGTSGAGGVFGKGVGTLLDKGVASVSLYVGGAALAAILVGGLFFASWAPADPIGYDLLVFDSVTLYNLATPGGKSRLQDAGNYGGITWSSYPKGFTIKAANVAEYREQRQYWSDDEESKYGLDFMITRLP